MIALDSRAMLLCSRCAGLAGFLAQSLIGVADSFVLVRIRRTQGAHVGGYLAQKLAVAAGQNQRRKITRGLLDLHIDTVGQIKLDGVRVAEVERGDAALHFALIANSENLQFAREARGHAIYGIRGQGARQTMQGSVLVAIANDFQVSVRLPDSDSGRNRNGLLALGPFHQQLIADGELYALGNRYWFFSNS